jgi:hypothetical protein
VKCDAEISGIDDAEPDRAKRGSGALIADSVIQIAVPALHGRLEGKVAVNGTVIRGTWTVPGMPVKDLQLSRTDTATALRDLRWCR